MNPFRIKLETHDPRRELLILIHCIVRAYIVV